MIGLLTDSDSQIPAELVERYGIAVVPLTVVVDGTEFAEGEDLDADGFWARFTDATPTVSTSQPSPGRFLAAYRALAEGGADEVLAVLIGSTLSGTVNSARLAAESSPVPVRIVDTGTASFGVACCTWEAGEALAGGATLEEAAAVGEAVAGRLGNVFTVGALELARAGGRVVVEAGAERAGVPVVSLVGSEVQVVGTALDVDGAAEVMAAHVRQAGMALRVGLGVADAGAAPLWSALEDRLVGTPEVAEVVRYRIGPSVGAHTGPGTAGCFYYPSAP